MEGVAWASPRLVAFHASFGPSAGQDLRMPVSLETPFRSGPRHCGQSCARAAAVRTDAIKPTAATLVTVRDAFMWLNPSRVRPGATGPYQSGHPTEAVRYP